ncbi:MAG: superoxide dismutase [Desulfobacteraceae bacterium]|jgi:Fe-Mn family superoxide dismutase
MAVTLPVLPFSKDDLAPHISPRTLEFHHEKHHQAYVTNLNKLIEGTDLAGKSLPDIVRESANNADRIGIFNNAAQVWNHTFYWQSMTPQGGGKPTGRVAEKINSDLGGYERFVEALKTAGLAQFGSGWVWLVLRKDTLDVIKTSNAETPIVQGLNPLLTVDVWEHAYYLDYQNRRGDYLDAFIGNLINWDFVDSNLP